ncbi:MAG: hypothetical protein J6N95_02210 [Bacilli bacterium]|nr:hypothetical protein [Bacilli bacterium]
MNFKKGISAVAILLALTLVGCNGNKESAKPSSAPASAQPSSSKTPSSKPSSSSAAPATSSTAPVAFPMPIAHTWTEGTPAANADGKNYTPLTDSAANKVGVKIAANDAVPGEGFTFDGGKIGPVNDSTAYVTFKVKAPKAGNYQMVMSAKTSQSGNDYTIADRGLRVVVNDGDDCEVYGDRLYTDCGLNNDTYAQFVVAQPVALTGNEDTIKLFNPNYRIVFDLTADVIFAEL